MPMPISADPMMDTSGAASTVADDTTGNGDGQDVSFDPNQAATVQGTGLPGSAPPATGTDGNQAASSAMDTGVSTLRTMLSKAYINNGLTMPMPGTGNVTDATNANLDRDLGYIGQLDTTYRQWVLNGQRDDGTPYSLSQWLSFADTTAQDILAQQGAVNDASLWAGVKGTVAQTALSVASGISNIAPKVAIGGSVVLIVVLALAVVYFIGRG